MTGDDERPIDLADRFWACYGDMADHFGTVEERDALTRAIQSAVVLPATQHPIRPDILITSAVEGIAWAAAHNELAADSTGDEAIAAIVARMTFPAAAQVGHLTPDALWPVAAAIWSALHPS